MPDAVSLYAGLSDRQRRNLRGIMEAVGCFRCSSLTVEQGRNVNAYGCRRHLCERMQRARKILDAAVEEYNRG